MKNIIKIRNTNIELLRIISILLIITFHYVYKSNYEYSIFTINTLSIKSIYFFGELGVNLFILITGYYLCESKSSLKKIILLIAEVFFFNILNYSFGYLVGYHNITLDVALIFPIIFKKYWFITAYLLIYILSPFYNILINNLKKRKYQKFLLLNLIIWCLIPTIFGLYYNSSENILFYNRFIWLTYMYFVGAYIKKYTIKFLNSKKNSLITCILTFSLMLISIIIFHFFKDTFTRIGTTEIAYFWTPNNILMFILSISFFMYFTKLNIKNNIIINKIASTTLGIYLLHDGHLTPYIWQNIFHTNINIYSNYWFIHLIFATLSIFIIGVIIDLIRQSLEFHTIKKILNLKIWSQITNTIKINFLKIIDNFI